eukprot:3489841-Pyramimonas_sp.AAC.1
MVPQPDLGSPAVIMSPPSQISVLLSTTKGESRTFSSFHQPAWRGGVRSRPGWLRTDGPFTCRTRRRGYLGCSGG